MNPWIIVLVIFAIIVVIAAIGFVALILKPFIGGKAKKEEEVLHSNEDEK